VPALLGRREAAARALDGVEVRDRSVEPAALHARSRTYGLVTALAHSPEVIGSYLLRAFGAATRRNALDDRIEVRLKEERNRQAALVRLRTGRIDDAMEGRDPAIVRPPRHEVADVDDDGAWNAGYETRAVANLRKRWVDLRRATSIFASIESEKNKLLTSRISPMTLFGTPWPETTRKPYCSHAEPISRAIARRRLPPSFKPEQSMTGIELCPGVDMVVIVPPVTGHGGPSAIVARALMAYQDPLQ